jgi:short-subunit dehydrogenase
VSKLSGSHTLLTGASSGLGVALARNLAQRGSNLVLTARSEPPMRRLADELHQKYGVEVVVEPLDLSAAGGAQLLRQRLEARSIEPDILVNNAGFGINGHFVDNDPDRLRAMLQLNVVSLTELSHAFGRRMASRGSGHILLVASMAAYQPDPLLAAYGASKAYVLSLGEALNVELAPKVGVTVLSPGLMDTGFNAVSGFEPPASLDRTKLLPAEVARIGLDAMFAGKSSVIAGRINQVMSFSNRLLSRHFSAKTTYRMAGASRHTHG